jgi:hypothetical protein
VVTARNPTGAGISVASPLAGSADSTQAGTVKVPLLASLAMQANWAATPCDNFRPSWSRDGRWVYFSSTRGRSSKIWRIPASGWEAAPVTRNGGFEALESGNSRALYYVKNRQEAGLWRTLPNGGSEAPVCRSVREGTWTIAGDAIYFIDPVLSKRDPRNSSAAILQLAARRTL